MLCIFLFKIIKSRFKYDFFSFFLVFFNRDTYNYWKSSAFATDDYHSRGKEFWNRFIL